MRGNNEKNQTRFAVFYAIAVHAAMGVAWSGNLLMLFVFYEILTASTVPLVTHKQSNEAREAGRLYIAILFGSSVILFLPAMIYVWLATGTLDFTQGGIIRDVVPPWVLPWLLAAFAFGIGKAALMPLHRWLPAAMVAPTPVSALLHAVAVVKAGVFSILMVTVYIFGSDYLVETGASLWLVAVASFTILASSFVAITKDDLKARLAYSTISQLSYIVLGAAIASRIAVEGAALHIVMHAAGKITLFFVAGAIYVQTHIRNISDLDGLGTRMPWLFRGVLHWLAVHHRHPAAWRQLVQILSHAWRHRRRACDRASGSGGIVASQHLLPDGAGDARLLPGAGPRDENQTARACGDSARADGGALGAAVLPGGPFRRHNQTDWRAVSGGRRAALQRDDDTKRMTRHGQQ